MYSLSRFESGLVGMVGVAQQIQATMKARANLNWSNGLNCAASEMNARRAKYDGHCGPSGPTGQESGT